MSFLTLFKVEMKKIKRTRIMLILLIPVILIWATAIINGSMNFDMPTNGMSPEHNFFIQSFLVLTWFMLPASIIVTTTLLSQIEYSNNGILKMLALPISQSKLCLAKFCVILWSLFVMILFMFIMYFPTALIVSTQYEYNLVLSLFYILKICVALFISSIPMVALYWLISVLIKNPVISIGFGLATVVPIVLIVNTEMWIAFPMSYPMMLMTSEMNRLSMSLDSFSVNSLSQVLLPVIITIVSIILSCFLFGQLERLRGLEK